jgi:hypothetical protein
MRTTTTPPMMKEMSFIRSLKSTLLRVLMTIGMSGGKRGAVEFAEGIGVAEKPGKYAVFVFAVGGQEDSCI